ncbi:MAG: tRNA-dihydrouridine synthase [Candidatus Moranbacteria bacterium]|jgi:nifR3 family TIM-barrel protein|nr:tRNA-dihydrouridine synthase [Candidatus Moranbacteria bacterium]
MAGITDLPFRLVCKEFGADAVYSEMISAAGLFYNSKKTKLLLQTLPEEQPIIFQLFGARPEHFAKAAKIITAQACLSNKKINQEVIKTDSFPTRQFVSRKTGLDINFGCPVKKVLKQGAGCKLMENLSLSRKIIETVTRNTHLPVSLKIRAGIGKIDAIKFLENVSDLPWERVMIHGRTFAQGFSGPIDFDLIKRIKRAFPEKIIIANGNIHSPENAKETLERTKADGIALATGALGRPWLFKQIREYLNTGKYTTPKKEEVKEVAIRHASYYKKFKGNNFQEFRKHLGWYFKDFPNAKKIRKRLTNIASYEETVQVIKIL